MNEQEKILGPAWRLFLFLTLATGALYPLAITLLAQGIFPNEAQGSPIERDGKVVASRRIGQTFEDPGHFWGRPSATGGVPYNGFASAGSNLAPSNPALAAAVAERVEKLKASDPGQSAPIPVDLVTASGSGLDPDISPAAAHWQAGRVARARGLEPAALDDLIARRTRDQALGFLGEARVNVLELNLALEALASNPHSATPKP